jgi:hypothetical protein
LADDLWLVLGTWAAVSTAIFAVWRETENNNKTRKLNGLALVFQKLNGETQRYARKQVVTAYYQYLKKNDEPLEYTPFNFEDHPVYDIVQFDKNVLPYVEIVRADFEEIAVMIKNGLVDQKAFFDAYWGAMLRCYMALHGYIETVREKSGTKEYTIYFQEQSEEHCLSYWRDNHYDSDIIFYADQ